MQTRLNLGAIPRSAFAPGRSHPKTARPLATRQPMHVVMRASNARGDRSFLAHDRAIQSLIQRQAARFGLKLFEIANAGNHLHLVFQLRRRKGFAHFARAVAGLIAKRVGCVWDARPFSRIVSWGRDFRTVRRYAMINRLETTGMERESIRRMLDEAEEMMRGPPNARADHR